jgi:hypothetical protein
MSTVRSICVSRLYNSANSSARNQRFRVVFHLGFYCGPTKWIQSRRSGRGREGAERHRLLSRPVERRRGHRCGLNGSGRSVRHGTHPTGSAPSKSGPANSRNQGSRGRQGRPRLWRRCGLSCSSVENVWTGSPTAGASSMRSSMTITVPPSARTASAHASQWDTRRVASHVLPAFREVLSR